MKAGLILSVAAVVTGFFGAMGAEAGTIAVSNPSFETLSSGPPLPETSGCTNPGCSYSEGSIPGWTVTGSTGQFIPGNPTYTNIFNYLPDGVTVAFSNNGTVSQTVVPTSVAGATVCWIPA